MCSLCTAGQSTTLGPKGLAPLNGVNTTFLHNLRRQARPFFTAVPDAATTL